MPITYPFQLSKDTMAQPLLLFYQQYIVKFEASYDKAISPLMFLLSNPSTPSAPSVSVSWIPLLRQWGVTGSLLLTVVLKGLLHSHSLSVHFMVHIMCSPFVRWLLALPLISLTPTLSYHNKSDTLWFQRMVDDCCFVLGTRSYMVLESMSAVKSFFSPKKHSMAIHSYGFISHVWDELECRLLTRPLYPTSVLNWITNPHSNIP